MTAGLCDGLLQFVSGGGEAWIVRGFVQSASALARSGSQYQVTGRSAFSAGSIPEFSSPSWNS